MPGFYDLIQSTCGEHLWLQSYSCKMKQRVMGFLCSHRQKCNLFSDWLNQFCAQCCWISSISISVMDSQQKTRLLFINDESTMLIQACPFCLRESKAQISCTVCFFLSILYRRHCTGPSALINTSRREWLFLKMWRSRTCQFMPLYECFGMTACSASQCFCSSC